MRTYIGKHIRSYGCYITLRTNISGNRYRLERTADERRLGKRTHTACAVADSQVGNTAISKSIIANRIDGARNDKRCKRRVSGKGFRTNDVNRRRNGDITNGYVIRERLFGNDIRSFRNG